MYYFIQAVVFCCVLYLISAQENVIINGKASLKWKYPPYYNYPAFGAIDGNPSTFAVAYAPGSFWRIEFDRVCHLTNVQVTMKSLSSFYGTIYYLTLNKSIDSSDSSDNVTTFTVSTSRRWFRYPQIYADTLTFPVNSSARSLTLTTGRDGDLKILDVRGIENCSFAGRCYMNNGPKYNTHPAKYAIDGNRQTYAIAYGPQATLVINLGKTVSFTGFKIRIKSPFTTVAIEGEYLLFVSQSSRLYDGEPEPPFVKFKSSKDMSPYPNLDPWTWEFNVTSKTTGKYIMLYKIGRGNMHVYEIEAFVV